MPHDGLAMRQPEPVRHVPLLALRAAVFAVVGTALGVSAHHLLAGGPLPWSRGAVAAAVLFVIGLAGGRRPRPLPVVALVSGAAQAGLHAWLASGTHSRQAPAAVSASGHEVHGMHGGHGQVPPGTHEVWHDRLQDSAAMTVAHVAVALFAAVLLHRADRLCWVPPRAVVRVVAATGARIATARALLGRRPAPSARRNTPRRPIARRNQRPPPAWAVLTDVVTRRGPPPQGPIPVI